MGLLMYKTMVDELPRDVAKWSVIDVETFLTSKMNGFDEEDIRSIKVGNVNGKGFLQLTRDVLTSEFKIKFMPSVEIMELVKEINDKREKELIEGTKSISLDNKGKASETDASRNVNTSADVTLYQLFDKGYIKKDDPLLYYRKTKTHNTVFSVRKIVEVDKNSRITTSLPSGAQTSRSNHLTELEETVVKDFNEYHKLDGDKQLKPNRNPFPYFFIGTSFFELRKNYYEKYGFIM